MVEIKFNIKFNKQFIIPTLFGLVVLAFLFWYISNASIKEKIEKYIREELGIFCENFDFKDIGNIYEVKGCNFILYFTKDGKYFIRGYPEEIKFLEKRDVPKIIVFTMPFCPACNMFYPNLVKLYDEFKDYVKFEIYPSEIQIHGDLEVLEALREYCMINKSIDNYFKHLKCYINLNSSECFNEKEPDKVFNCLFEKYEKCYEKNDEIEKCVKELNRSVEYLPFRAKLNFVSEINSKYNIFATPTIIINDKKVNLDIRDYNQIKKIVCNAFLNPPNICKS